MLTWQSSFPVIGKTSRLTRTRKTRTPVVAFSTSSHLHQRSLRYAVLGAGFAGLSVAWHLLEHSPAESNLSIDVLDEIGIGGGASGVSGGLLHPYSPKVKPLWRATECWEESLRLINIAETAINSKKFNGFIARRKGILRPSVSLKNMSVMNDALYVACENLAKDLSNSGSREKEINFHKRSIDNLLELEGDYDAVIVCLGARSTFLPELLGKLPLRTCRGVIAHLHLPDNIREEFPEHSPSILSDAWIAIQNPRKIHLGSTWEWKSCNYSQNVSIEESSKALEELLPKVSAVYPNITKWAFYGASAGLRAMPPVTGNGSLPILGQIDEFIGQTHKSKFWLFSGLGSRGLLYHGWLGKLMARAVIACDEDVIPDELTSWRPKLINK